MEPEARKTCIVFAIAYSIVLLFFYSTVFRWDDLNAFGLIPDFLLYPCGGRRPPNPILSRSINGTHHDHQHQFSDPLLLNSHQSENHNPESPHRVVVSAYESFLISPYTLLVYWTASLFFFLLDLYYDQFCPAGTWKSKKHPQSNMQNRPIWKLYRHGILLTLCNSITSIFGYHVLTLFVARRFDALFLTMCANESLTEPTYLTVMRLIASYFLTDVIFYVTHRFAHEFAPAYRYVHKEHHKFVDTYAVCAAACNPIEHIGVNLLTIHFAPMLAGLPITTWVRWFSMLASLNTTCTHSGFTFIPSFQHDEHHHYQLCEFGTALLMDATFRTTTKDRIKGGDVIEEKKRRNAKQ